MKTEYSEMIKTVENMRVEMIKSARNSVRSTVDAMNRMIATTFKKSDDRAPVAVAGKLNKCRSDSIKENKQN